MRRTLAAALALLCRSAIPGCEWRGLNSLGLPGTAGTGRDSYTIQAQLPDVTTIQQNTRVRVGVWVLLFLGLLSFLTWRLNAAYWKDIK